MIAEANLEGKHDKKNYISACDWEVLQYIFNQKI